jgi:adenylyl-sulfate kinase
MAGTPPANTPKGQQMTTRYWSDSPGFVLWLTGLSGAGKSTLARTVAADLAARGHRVELLDGDEVRANLTQDLGFSRADRDSNIARIGYVAGKLAKHDVAVVVAAISPYRQARDKVRASVPSFVEVFVDAPLETCVQRDPKGLYAKAIAGEIANFTGVSDPYEAPLDPELVVHTDAEPVGGSAGRILDCLESRGLTKPRDDAQRSNEVAHRPAPAGQ